MLPITRTAARATVQVLPNTLTPAPVLVTKSLSKVSVAPKKTGLLDLPKSAITASAGANGPCQVRFSHTDVRVPDFSTYRRSSNADPKQENTSAVPARMFSYVFTSGLAVGGIYLGKNIVQNVIASIASTKGELAMAKIEVNLSDIPEGKSMLFQWQGKPLYIRHRTAEEIELMGGVNLNELRDPQHDNDRVRDPNWLIVIGICTHLGCVPVADMGDFGGFYCPCHGSHYDTAGRIRKGPAPLNLEVPYYDFPEEGLVVIG